MIKTIIFDLGGVIITLDHAQAVERFKALGLADADQQLDPYTQNGIFGDLEGGRIDAETFRKELSKLVGRELTADECCYAWQGYAKEVPRRNLEVLKKLRAEGYRLVLLSNTNPFMMEWVDSPLFDGEGHGIRYYMDECYLSYQMQLMKPDDSFFRKVLMKEQIFPYEVLFVDDGPRNVAAASQMGINTYCPVNGANWACEIFDVIRANNQKQHP
jgi:putative hydrolase of the HAD superfamily